MTELVSIPEELKAQLRVPLIANSKRFQELWNIQRYLSLMKARQLYTSEIQKYCDAAVKKRILLDNNEYLGLVLYASLKEIASYLSERYIKFHISTYLSNDIYLPNWQGITISIEIAFRNFHERMRIWRDIENKITRVIIQFKESKRLDLQKIDEANETIATTIDNPDKKLKENDL